MFNPPGFAASGGKTISTWPRVLVQIAWNAGGNTASPNHWYTVSDRLRGSWKASLSGRQYESDQVESGTFTFTLDNLDGVFDPDNTASPFYPNVVPYRRCRLVFMANPSQNLCFPWMAGGTATTNQAASIGTLSTASGLPVSYSGLSTAITWAIPSSASSGATYGVLGATQSWSTNDASAVTVTPGLSYSIGVDMSVSSGMATLPVQVQIAFYSLTGSPISVVSSATTTLSQSGWSRLTASGTAPAGAAFAVSQVVTQAATTSATTLLATAWQIERASAPTAYVSPGTWEQMWQGFIERWPQRYDKNGKYGMIDITAVDALAPLSQVVITNAMPTYMSQQGSLYMYDLATPGTAPDNSSNKAFLDLNGNPVALDIVGSSISTGTSISSTTQLGTLWNTPGPVITMSNNQASSQGNSANASYLQWANSNGKIVTLPNGGWTRMVCFRTQVTPGTGGTYALSSLWAATCGGFVTGSGDQSGAYLYINSSGYVGCNIQNSSGLSLARVNTSVPVCDGDWHCAILSLSADGKTLHLTVDDYWYYGTSATSVASGSYTHDAFGTLLADGGIDLQPFNGDMAWIAQWQSELSVDTQLDITNGFARGWTGDNNGTRLGRIMSLSNFQPGASGRFRFAGSYTLLGSATISGRSPSDVMQECADTEVGQFTVDRLGVPTLFGQLWRWKQNVPRVTFGEGAGEIPYQANITFEQDPAHLYNDIQITCDGALDLTDANALQEAQDLTSQGNYFPQTLQKTINPYTVQGGLNIATYLLSQFKDPHTRLSGLSVDCASNPSALPALLDLNFADLVQVNRRPTGAPMKSLKCFIEQISWSGDDTGRNLVASFQMSPASQYEYGIVSAWHATLSTAPAIGATTLNINAPQVTQVYNWDFSSPGTWQVVGGNAATGPITTALDGTTTVGKATTYTIMEDSTSIPYDPTKTYRVSVTVRTATTPITGSPTVYLGLTGIDANGNRVNTIGANSLSLQIYCAARGVQAPATYTTYTGYVSGTATPGDAGSNPDPANPERVRPEVVAVRPLVYLLYGCTDGVQYVDSFTIHTVPAGGGLPLISQLPPGQQLTLGQGTANAETVTVSAVGATSPGWVTSTVTLTSATTKSHSVNDYLCDPLPSNVTLPPGGTYPTCFDDSSLTGGSQPLIGF